MPDDLFDDLPIGTALANWVGQRCGQAPDDIDRDCPLVEFGLSSVDAVELAGRLEQRLGRSLPATLLWEHPTINKLERALTSAPEEPSPPPVLRRDRAEDAAIAVVGLGCRLPAANGPDELWRLLLGGRDAVRTVPAERWRLPTEGDQPEGSIEGVLGGAGRWGGFLGDVARFDAEFFGITPGEARLMDPQQRILLEVAWEALAHAALDPAGLRGSQTGVYVGISSSEYAHLTTSALEHVQGWTATGGALSIAANRLSYLMDLRGPSLAVDTACSSSLVAIHLAVTDLRRRQTDLALAAGVNLLLDPTLTVAFGRAGGLAPGGRCRPFDAAADGIVRGEGCGVVVLKRLADALRDGDRVLALVRGAAVNSDGRSNGLVAPNPHAQEALLRQAYADAGWDPSTVDYVQTHGTGTPLGDPIEAGALGAVCGAGRSAGEPLLIGSVKSHLGHLEAAAGVAGFITTVLALHHGTVPPTIHHDRPNPLIPLAACGLRVPTRPEPLPTDRAARAGVSAFGFGGTNAHVVLEAFGAATGAGGTAEEDRPAGTAGRPAVCVVADRDPDRVRAQAGALARWLSAHPAAEPGDVAGTLARRGERGPVRAAVTARTRADLVAGLAAVSVGRPDPHTATGAGGRAADGGIWVFSGYGTHWPAMGAALLDREPAFAATVDALDPLFRDEVGVGLRDGLRAERDLSVRHAQPLTFGMQVALAELWRSYGLEPAGVIGHSMGEVAAAVVAGALAPSDGVRLIAHRARLLATVGPGAMAVVDLSEEEFEGLAEGLPEVSVAVVAAPDQLVVTGAPAAVEALAARVRARGGAVRTVTTEGAGHSAAVDGLLPALRAALTGLAPRWPWLPFYSTVNSGPPLLDADYWLANLRQPVRLADAVRLAAGDGFGFFLEISPHPVLARPVSRTLAAAGVPEPLVAGSLRRQDPDAFARSLATVCAHGHRVPAADRSRVLDLPVAPWRGERHWHERSTAPGRSALPGDYIDLPGEDRHVWRLADLGDDDALLLRRTPGGADALPLAGLVGIAAAAIASAGSEPPGTLEISAATLEGAGAYPAETALTTTLAPAEPGERALTVHAPAADGGWVRLGHARLRDAPTDRDAPAGPDVPADRQAPAAETPIAPGPDPLGACLAVLAGAAAGASGGPAWLAVSAGAVRLSPGATGGGLCRVWLHAPASGDRHDSGDGHSGGGNPGDDRIGRLRLVDAEGTVLLAADRVVLRRGGSPADRPRLLRGLVRTVWREQPPPTAGGSPAVPLTLLGGPGDPLLAAALTDPVAPEGVHHAGLAAAAQATTPGPATPPGHDTPAAPDAPPAGQAGDVVLIAPAGGDRPDPDAARALALAAVRAAAGAGRLWLVTRGGAGVEPDEPGRPDLAWIRGLVRTLAFESPVTRATWLDVDPLAEPAAQAAQLWAEVYATPGEDEIAWRGGRRWAARLVRQPLPARRPGPPPVRAGAAYVLTGGYGGIGVRVARWLAAGGAGRLVLSGRSGVPPRAVPELDALRRSGVDVRVVLGDLAEPDVAERLVRAAGEDGVPLAGVVHAAGVRHDRLLPYVGADDLAQVWAPKAHAALRLHAAIEAAGVRLDWWVSFSSAAALLGSPGQVAYATANAWLDAFAGWQRARGVPAWSVEWGVWSEVGGATGVRLPGLDPIEPDDGVAVLDALLRRAPGTVGVLHFDADTALAAFPEAGRLPFFAEVTGEARDAVPGWNGADRLRDLPPYEAIRVIGDRLAERIVAVLGTDPPRDAPLTDTGLDSLAAVRVKNLIEVDFGRSLPTSALVRGATLNDVVAALAADLGIRAVPEPAPVSTPPGAGPGPRDAAERAAMRLFETAVGRSLPGIEWRLDGPDQRADVERLAEAARREYGVDVEPARLLADPTPRALAEPLRAAEQAEVAAAGPVRALRAVESDRPPLFLAHPAGGSTHVYRQLVGLLDLDQPVYGLERLETAGPVAQRAARYVRELREAFPAGPYRLGGWSFGGALAFEMARQLVTAGEKVDTLVLIDAGLPVPTPPDEAARLLSDRFVGFLRYLSRTYGAPIDVDPARLRELTEDEQFELVLGQMAAAGLAASLPPAVLRHQVDSHRDTRALDEYRPGEYAGPVTLYRCTQPTPWAVHDPRYDHVDAARGWDRYCTDLRIVPVPGHHLNLLDPPAVEVIASDLRRLL